MKTYTNYAIETHTRFKSNIHELINFTYACRVYYDHACGTVNKL